jgi:hypothetical protein
LLPNLFQVLLSLLMLHIGFVGMLPAIPVLPIGKIDRLQLFLQGGKRGLTDVVIIHDTVLCHDSCHFGTGKQQ